MLGDDAGAPPPIKGVCRSASIALRKANLAKETGDEDEELAQLRSFNRTVVNVLRLHPMYARKKQDEEVAGLDAKLPEVHRRMEALGGKVAPPAENISEAAASVAAARLVAGGGKVSLLERRRQSRASSRAGSRAPSAAPSRDASPDRARSSAGTETHTPHYVVTDLSRRLAAMEQSDKARVAREAETEARMAELARRADDAEAAARRADTRAETAETLVWELQEALQALSPALEGSSETENNATAWTSRADRLEALIREVDERAARRAEDFARKPSSPTAGRLADLEAQVLPTRVAELEQRVAELAEVSAVDSSKARAGKETRADGSPERPSDAARSPGEPFSAEVRDLRERVARLEHVDVGSAEWAHAAEAKAAAALARVDALEKAVDAAAKASASRPAPEEASDADTRAAVASLQVRVRRAEAAAAEAMELAATTSPGTARAKSAVPELRNRVTDVEVGVEAASARVSDVETRVNQLSSAAHQHEGLEARLAAKLAAAARDAAREATASSAPLPKPSGDAASDRVDPGRHLEDTVESLRQARAVDQARVAELEGSVASAVSAMETLRDVVAEVEARHRESAAKQADAVGEVVAAMGGAVSALPKLDRRMQALEDARAEHAEALATAAARVAALEADTETAARLSSKLAERARAAKADLGELKETVRRSVSADAVKTLVAAVSGKVSRLAQETADTVDAMKREQKRAEKATRDARPASGRAAEAEKETRETRALAEKAASMAERASESAESASAAAKKARALAETAAAAPARFAGELADTVESLREARAMDTAAAAELERRVRELEAARGVERAAAPASPTLESLERARKSRRRKDPVGTAGTSSSPSSSGAASPKSDEAPGANGARAETETPRPDLEPRVEALGAAVAAAAEGIKALRERLEALVESKNEDWLVGNLRGDSGGPSAAAPNAAAFGAAEAAAGAAETLAEAVARLHARMAAVEAAAAAGTATDAKAGSGAGADELIGSGNPSDASRDRSGEGAGGDTAGNGCSGAPGGDPAKASKDSTLPAIAPEASSSEAGAAAGESAEPSDADLVHRARLAASIARRAVRDEAARLGITLGGGDAGDADADGLAPEDVSAELSRRADEANAADRELAAELATVCALVEKEEARRETLRVALASAENASPGGTESGEADDAVAVAARREWATCMEAQLRRLRAAAREAEARNAAAAQELAQRPGGLGSRSGAMRAVRAAAERREAAIADRLARVARRVDAAFGPEMDAVESFGKENAFRRGSRPAPWGAGPGLKGTSIGSKGTSTKHTGGHRVDSALSALERRVDALARAAASGAPMPGAFPSGDASATRPAPRDAVWEGGALEVKSLRQMMRRAQTELGALSGRVEAVETKVREAGRLERDLRTARLTDKRADALSSVSSNVAADAARASERAAAAARDAAALRAQYAEVADSVASQREGLRNMGLKVDGLARDVDVSAKSAEAAADRARGQARSANASAKSAEARTVALAGALGRVARHVGLRGVGDALRTGVLWEDLGAEGSREGREREDAEDRFEITAFANEGA